MRRSTLLWFIGGVLVAASSVSRGATEASWLNLNGGDWSSAQNWSTAPIVPANGSPTPEATYDVVFDTASPTPYDVLMSAQNLALDQMVIRDPATVQQFRGDVQIGQLDIEAGRYLLTGNATLRNATIDATSGILQIDEGRLYDSTVRGNLLFSGDRNRERVMRNVQLRDAAVEAQGDFVIDGQLGGTGVVELVGSIVSISSPSSATIGPGVTMVIAEDAVVRFRAGGAFQSFGQLDVSGTVTLSSTFFNAGQVRIRDGGTFGRVAVRQKDDPTPSFWTIDSGGVLSTSSAMELGSGSDITLNLQGAVNNPLIVARDFLANGVLRLRTTESYMPRTDIALPILRVSRSVDGQFSKLDLSELPAGFSWDTSKLLTTGLLSVEGPDVERIAYTEFEEPPLDAMSYNSTPSSLELGFETGYRFNDGNFPAGGVNDFPGERALSFQSLDTTTTFDTLPVAEYANVAVDLVFSVLDTSYEPDDFVVLTVRTDDWRDGTVSATFDLWDFNDVEKTIDRVSVNIPTSWTEATIEIETKTDSSSGAERVNLLSVNVVAFGFDERMQQPGDFAVDGVLDPIDLTKLDAVLRRGVNSPDFDLDGNGQFDKADRLVWIESLWGSYVGDANEDGQFDSSDMIRVFQFGQYENVVPNDSDWQSGDWNGDGDFTSSDLLLAFQRGGYEQGPRAATRAVPEPSSVWLLVVAAVGMLTWRRPTGLAAKIDGFGTVPK